MAFPYRVGFGFDVHPLQEGYPLWLGGVRIEHHKGAVGHSDADVLLHAVCDAILGAAALGDIGIHFPNTDARYKGIDSKLLLKESYQLVRAKGWKVGNIDATLVLEEPKIKPYIIQMLEVISVILEVSEDDVSVKATTNEKLGYVGTRDGVDAYAVALLYRNND
jgi:2-C-methyl-D-erythritol 2,4-cyclodiphosphate synthase